MKNKYSIIFYDIAQSVVMGLPIAAILSIIIALLCGNALSLSAMNDYEQDLKNIELVDRQYASTSKNIAYIYNSQLDRGPLHRIAKLTRTAFIIKLKVY